MHTQIWDLRMYKNNVSQYPHIDEIKQTFLDGGLVAIPTETVYGLGANARNEKQSKISMLQKDVRQIIR